MQVKVTLKYKDQQYEFIPDQCDYASMHHARFMWEEGNFSCDCNKSLFIQRQCDEDLPEMECGDEIQLVSIEQMTT